ncbi:MAG: putative tail sheath protein [Thermomicrobiales bacterium]|jgi:phage tail sheath protein FI|nr:putative tail sheath protein [Thermomicrobiales bacterium]MDF3037647.1 putative tail sheath protein [Thermomicrobiales bacterium]
MSFTVSYPGVYIQELPSDVRTIVGVPTSVTAFIGRARRGLVDEPVRIFSFADFDRQFGGLWELSTLGFAVQQYFLNGGADAVIVRVYEQDGVDSGFSGVSLPGGGGPLGLTASSPGLWGDRLQVIVDYNTKDPTGTTLFNLIVQETVPPAIPTDPPVVVAEETFVNLSVDPDDPRYVTQVLAQQSGLVRVTGATPTARPTDSGLDPATNLPIPSPLGGGSDGLAIADDTIVDPALEDDKKGLWALKKADIFNLLCIPPLEPGDPGVDVAGSTWDQALAYCQERRAMLLVDPPAAWANLAPTAIVTDASTLLTGERKNAAVFFPRIRAANPLKENRLETFAPSGAVAGVFARIDASRGVWKAPAGQETNLAGVRELEVKLTDDENGLLNPQGINCLRSFPVAGRVVWGARTLEGADQLASQWKYIPVRRLALYIEETLYRNTGWVVFEPNDEPLWSQIRLSIGSFMQNLFRQGAFQGSTPRDAYLVKCDKETTTQTDIDSGIVNIIVGFAPLKPAEFVIIKIRQLAGQVAA